MKKLLEQSYKGIKGNRSRAILTMLGIVIGVATIILVLSAGEGFKSYLNYQIEQFGSNTLTIETVVPPTTKQRNSGGISSEGNSTASQAITVDTFKTRDVDLIKNLPNIKNVYGAVVSQDIASYEGKTKNAFLFGSSASRFQIDKGDLAYGRGYTEAEEKSLAQVVVLGSDISEYFFGEKNPVGEIIRVGSLNFRVVGVYEPRGSFGFSNDDEQLFLPLRTLQKKVMGIDYLFYAVAEVEDETLAEITAEDVRDLLRKSHQIRIEGNEDFRVATQKQNLSTFDTILKATTFLLLAVAAISLIVGGVGVMNIMYVVVTERTAEIGLKKALGAKGVDIRNEFLAEAALITFVGGFIGVLFGVFLAYIVSVFANSAGFFWAFKVPISGLILGMVISVGIGIFFGVFPAIQAAKLDPIEALRKE
ncbi:FtsX-like permease family protein [Candidatus Parcubacteria bacterium]|nr:FtsX-like permease family protein [Candidatus Parcubacteria bacterium]